MSLAGVVALLDQDLDQDQGHDHVQVGNVPLVTAAERGMPPAVEVAQQMGTAYS